MSYFKGFGNGSNSNGQFWYGRPQGFPGFLYKKNTGVGARKNPLYGLLCNKPTYIYNKFNLHLYRRIKRLDIKDNFKLKTPDMIVSPRIKVINASL